jgi:hypothetical protein
MDKSSTDNLSVVSESKKKDESKVVSTNSKAPPLISTTTPSESLVQNPPIKVAQDKSNVTDHSFSQTPPKQSEPKQHESPKESLTALKIQPKQSQSKPDLFKSQQTLGDSTQETKAENSKQHPQLNQTKQPQPQPPQPQQDSTKKPQQKTVDGHSIQEQTLAHNKPPPTQSSPLPSHAAPKPSPTKTNNPKLPANSAPHSSCEKSQPLAKGSPKKSPLAIESDKQKPHEMGMIFFRIDINTNSTLLFSLFHSLFSELTIMIGTLYLFGHSDSTKNFLYKKTNNEYNTSFFI